MARYRLRFALQEFDLPHGVTLIGRSLDCQLTLDDPLVSRRHARISLDDGSAQIEDLGSRNGVRVNGTRIREATSLTSGDRLRIGTHELVFTCVDTLARGFARETGHLRLCANCRFPYAKEAVACPGCGATEQTDDDVPTDAGSGSGRPWSVELVVEALERALRLGRVADATALLKRAALHLDEVVAAGGSVNPEALASLAVQAAATTMAGSDPAAALWAVEMFGRSRLVPPLDVVQRFAEVATRYPRPFRVAVGDLLSSVGARAASASASELQAIAMLRSIGAS